MHDRALLEVSYGFGKPEVVNDGAVWLQPAREFADTPAVLLGKVVNLLSLANNEFLSHFLVLVTNVAGESMAAKEAAVARVSTTASSVLRHDTTAGRRAQ